HKMPCYTNTEPDSFNLDTLLSKHGDKARVVTCNKNAKNLKVLSNNFNSQQCTDKEGFHFFMIPKQPTITICFCKKYHTYFATKTLKTYSNLQTASSTPVDKPQKNSDHQSNPASNGQTQQKTHQNEEPKSKTSKPREKDAPKTSQSTTTGQFDWFTNFPITLEMKQYDKLSTNLAQQLFFFIKSYLKEFTLGQPIKTNDPNTSAKLNQNNEL
ncbi:1409_t:CDS:2, partial [Gigaspora margarita]